MKIAERQPRILVVDDHAAVRAGLARAVEDAQMVCCAMAATKSEAMAQLAHTNPDAMVVANRGSSANVQLMWDETNDRWSTNNQPLTASALVNTTLQRYTEAVTVNTAIGSTYTIDLSTANIFDLTLTANVTFSVTNPPSSGTAQGATLLLRQDATGGRKVTFPSSFKWTDGDNANTYISTGANKIDVISIFTVDGGTVYLASQGMANVG